MQHIKNSGGGGSIHFPPPCATVGVRIYVYVRGLIEQVLKIKE